jgi:mycothiol system anti-sigma-R factor
MNRCDEYATKMLRYLDNDLEGQELEDFLSHLKSCASCQEHLVAEKELSATLHRSRPLYSAPAALRDRVAAAMSQGTSRGFQFSRHWHSSRLHGQDVSGAWQRFANWRVLTPVAIAVALCLAVVPNVERRVQAASYVETAVATHRSYVDGGLHRELKSSSAEEVTAWFAGKVPFDFRLPTADSTPASTPVYWLTGASLVNYKGNPAALVTYETEQDKISLLVDSSTLAVVAGGDEIRFGKLTFHYYNNSGFRVITWSNHGLSYALVSSVSGSARASCLVCHQNMADRDNFEGRQ